MTCENCEYAYTAPTIENVKMTHLLFCDHNELRFLRRREPSSKYGDPIRPPSRYNACRWLRRRIELLAEDFFHAEPRSTLTEGVVSTVEDVNTASIPDAFESISAL